MNPVQETVLLYYPKKPKYLPKIKSIFVQLGIQFRILDAASTAQKIGYLTGRTGFEKKYFRCPFFKNSTICAGDGSFFWCADGCAVFLFEKSRHSFHRPEGDRDRYQCRLDIFSHSIRRLQKNMHGCMQEEQSSHVSKSRILDVKDDRMG